jgi:alanine racemase
MDTHAYSTWLEIDLWAIKNNIKAIKAITNTQVMAVIKANGYGHGVLDVAKAVTEAGAEWCGVARMEEAIKLRLAGITSQIMVLGYSPPKLIPEAIQNDIHVAIYNPHMAHAYISQAKSQSKRLKMHVKVETGMGRLGMAVDQVPEFLVEFRQHPNLEIDGIFTHFARADEPDSDATHAQLRIFNNLLHQLRMARLCPPMVHAANSAAILNYPEAYFDMVRPGIAMFGLDPAESSPLSSSFKPALAWKARLTSVRIFPPGHGISYGGIYVTNQHERIGVIPVGYGDGYRRVPGHQVIVRGKRVDVVGRVCMDECMLQLDAVPDAVAGDEVVLLGEQAGQSITASDIAARYHTINYEVVCGLADRLPRVYLNA